MPYPVPCHDGPCDCGPQTQQRLDLTTRNVDTHPGAENGSLTWFPHLNCKRGTSAAHCGRHRKRRAAALQTIVSRATSPLDSIVISVTQLAGGDAFNVTPERTRLGGTLRALRPDTLDATMKRMTDMARGVAAAHGCTAEVSWGGTRPVYPPTVNGAGAWGFVKGVAEGCARMLL